VKSREERRDRTWRYGARARRIHLSIVHPNGVLDCVCERSVWKFAKGKSLGCNCGKRLRGRPKLGYGPCCSGAYREAVVERIASRRLCRAWREAVLSVDPLDVEL
jgi:hypothetical protein